MTGLQHSPGSAPRSDEASAGKHPSDKSPASSAMNEAEVRVFWSEGYDDDRTFHWCVDCPWIGVAAWHGARIVTALTPPSELWMCDICLQYEPRTVPVRLGPDRMPCIKCGCGRDMHIIGRGPFDRGCGMGWADADYDDDGSLMGASVIHCPCDGYEPPVGGRHLTLFDYPVEPYVEAGVNPTPAAFGNVGGVGAAVEPFER